MVFPATLLLKQNVGALTANSWNTLPITANLQANTTYWLVYNNNSSVTTANNLQCIDTGVDGDGAYSGVQQFGSMPQTLTGLTKILQDILFTLHSVQR